MFSGRLGWTIPYVICMGHKTNFYVERPSKASLMVDEFFSTSQEIYNFNEEHRSLW